MSRSLLVSAPTAHEINEAYRLASSAAESAVQHAIECGKLLYAKKQSLRHGEFQRWVDQNCEFAYSTAARWMRLSQNSTAVEISSIRAIFPSGRKPARLMAEQSSTPSEISPGAAPPSAPAASAAVEDAAAEAPGTGEVWTEADEAEFCQQLQIEELHEIRKVMEADDRLAAAFEQIKNLTQSRNRFMSEKSDALMMVKEREKTIKRLRSENDRLKAELEGLRERVALMTEAA